MTNSFTNDLDDLLKHWQNKLDEFRLQFSLGKMDAADEFEALKKRYRKYFNSFKQKLDELEPAAGKLRDKLKAVLDELEVQLALGKAETKEAFETQKENLRRLMDEATRLTKDLFNENKETLHDWQAMFTDVCDHLAMQLDYLRLYYHLGKKEADQRFESKRKEMEEQLKRVNERLDKLAKAGKEKWNDIYAEMQEAYKALRDNIQQGFEGK
jgi:gas vesicle protein